MKDVKRMRTKYTTNNNFDFFTLMTIGVLLGWVMVAGIIDTTIFNRDHLTTLIRMFFVVGAFGLFFANKTLMRIGGLLFVAFTIFISSGFISIIRQSENVNRATEFSELILRTIDFIIGNRPHDILYEQFTIWGLTVVFGLFVVFFAYFRFNFWVLFIVSIITNGIALSSPYFREERIFYVYIFCLLVILVLHLSQRNISKIKKPLKTSFVSRFSIGLIAMLVLVASFVPAPAYGFFSEGFFQNTFVDSFDSVNDWFSSITTPSAFSFNQIGFGNNNGRLGGDIELNDDPFMQINGDFSQVMPLYLMGTTRNVYTGSAWQSNNTNYHPLDFDAFESNLAIAEMILRTEIDRLSSFVDIFSNDRLNEQDPGTYFNGIMFDDDLFNSGWRLFIDESTNQGFWTGSPTPTDDWVVDLIEHGDLLRNSLTHNIRINTLERRTTTIFQSGIITGVTMQDDDISVLRNRDAGIVSERRMTENTIYDIGFIGNTSRQRNNNNELLVGNSYSGMLRNISSMVQEFRELTGYDFSLQLFEVGDRIISLEELLENYLIPRSDQIRFAYTSLPNGFPNRVKDLALDVTRGARNDFEKMLLLEDFLRTSFPYTLTPGNSPRNQDFVDHFLFEIKKGYCVHFATAFVTMARSLGMPARYVEGFLVNERGSSITVRNNMAHAWAEVYFEGYGWVIFEPTPAYDSQTAIADNEILNRDNYPETDTAAGDGEDDLNDDLSSNEGYETSDGENPDDADEAQNDSNQYDEPPENDETNDENDENTPYQTNGYGTTSGPGGESASSSGSYSDVNHDLTQSNPNTRFFVKTILFLKIAGILFLIRFVSIGVKQLRLSRKGNRVIALNRFESALEHFKILGYDMKHNETVFQFAHRIDLEFTDYEKQLLYKTGEVFAKARYSDQNITLPERQIIEKLISRLDEKVENHVGKIRYLIYRYIFAKI